MNPHLHDIADTIVSELGGRKIELDYETDFQLLIAVILSAQTTDKQVNRITPSLFALIREPHDILTLSREVIESHIQYVNFYRNKARYIHETGMILAEKYDGIIPDDLDLIQTLPGVGVKTARVVISVLYDRPYVGVDTHIHRVMNRLGIVSTHTPIETDRQIDQIFSEEEKRKIHHPFVLFGRYVCIARRPKCQKCRVREWCQYREKTE